MKQYLKSMILNMEVQRLRCIKTLFCREQKAVLVDDLIATGGTIEACTKLIERLGGEVVKIIFLMELAGLKGRDKLAKYDVSSVITYEGK